MRTFIYFYKCITHFENIQEKNTHKLQTPNKLLQKHLISCKAILLKMKKFKKCLQKLSESKKQNILILRIFIKKKPEASVQTKSPLPSCSEIHWNCLHKEVFLLL